MEGSPETKRNEQYPLLKLDTGGGDNKQTSGDTTTPSHGWTISAKQAWMDKCPDLLSACWMTLVLLGVAMLAFYAVGLGVHRRSFRTLGCPSSRPGSNVFFHQVIQRSSYLPLNHYQDFLAKIAQEFPFLKIHVLFLIDDSWVSAYRVTRHSKIMNKFLYYPTVDIYNSRNPANEKEILDFVTKYNNVNITVVRLSHYMSMSPLKNKWRSIPLQYIPFYARVYDVWQYGGVGLDLESFNTMFKGRRCLDRKLSSILRQHNKGIKNGEYAKILNTVELEDESENLMIFIYRMLNQIMDDSKSIFNRSEIRRLPEKEETLVRTHRAKRAVLGNSIENLDPVKEIKLLSEKTSNNIDNITIELFNETKAPLVIPLQNASNSEDQKNNSNTKEALVKMSNHSESMKPDNKTEKPRVVLFYDFVLSGNPISLSDSLYSSPLHSFKKEPSSIRNKVPTGNEEEFPDLTVHSEGLFVAATMRLHPFLNYLLTSSYYTIDPKFAIENAYFTQCSYPFMSEDAYCNHIFLL